MNNHETTSALLQRLHTELQRRTEIAEADTARAEATLREVRSLRLAVFALHNQVNQMLRAAGVTNA